eukprot:g6731.t1
MKVDVSVVKVQSDGNVLVKYKQQGHDRMLNFVIEFVKDCDAVKTLGRKLVLFLEHEDKLKSAEKVWTRFRKELSEYESDFVKTIDFIHMKPLYWAIREREIGVLDGMIRRVPRMRDALRQAWNKMYENEDLDTVLKQFETKLQSLPNPRQHYCLPKHVRIECISDKETLLNAEKDILNSDILGVDAEWTNFMPKFNPDPTVSLLQLVTRDVAYLLIVPELETQTLRDVLRRIFTSSTLTTICFGGSEDVKRLKAQVRKTSSSDNLSWLRFDMDLAKVASRVLPKKSWSLSKLVDRFIGKPLDKSVRMTDWNRRPLTPAQKAYAAADGYTLIVLHDILKWREENRGATGTHARLGFVAMFSLFVWGKFLR